MEIENDTCDYHLYLILPIVVTAMCPALQTLFVNAKHRSTEDLFREVFLLRISSS